MYGASAMETALFSSESRRGQGHLPPITLVPRGVRAGTHHGGGGREGEGGGSVAGSVAPSLRQPSGRGRHAGGKFAGLWWRYGPLGWSWSSVPNSTLLFHHATKASWAQFHEKVLARTVLHAGNFLWMAQMVMYVTSVSTTLWTSQWSEGKVHWVNLKIYNGVNVNVKDIVKQWHFLQTSNLKRGCGYVLLADHRKWPEFKTVLAKTISCNWVQIN